MKFRFNRRFAALSVAGFLSLGADARDASPAPFVDEQEIRQFFADQDSANRAGQSTEALARRFYADDVVVSGEGEPGLQRGIKGAIDELGAWFDYLGPGGNKGCSFTVDKTIVSAPGMASAFVLLHCNANPPKLQKEETVRQLFVLRRTPQGWRVAQEMWQAGGFAK